MWCLVCFRWLFDREATFRVRSPPVLLVFIVLFYLFIDFFCLCVSNFLLAAGNSVIDAIHELDEMEYVPYGGEIKLPQVSLTYIHVYAQKNNVTLTLLQHRLL